jgi:hypothetical protein
MDKHPYEEYENLEAWQAVKKAIEDLERNKDIILSTKKEHIIGYIVKHLSSKSF